MMVLYPLLLKGMKARVSSMKLAGVLMTGLCLLPLLSEAGRPDFNNKEIPQSLDDLREIQAALQANLEKTRAATVCLQKGGGSGSAVIISADGLVLTAAHVTGKVGEEMTVVMEDGSEHKGISLGLNSETDSAMLQLQGEGPFPFVKTDFDKERGVNVRVGRLVRNSESTIQSDCMLIGGDSGGPLFNLEGELIGIHSRVGASREQSMHVPIREFQSHWEELKKGDFIGNGSFAQRVEPGSGFLGIRVEESEEGGLQVLELFEGAAAEEAGLKVGDRIIEISGKEANRELFDAKLAELGAGEDLILKWISGEETKEETLTLGEKP